jgi:UDP-GlcNAc:undecaprenyl-phosphate/decaprenyl-phosphate GlcNAc-1-phosphate transferase
MIGTVLFVSFLVSAFGCLLLVRYQHLHGHMTMDAPGSGPQKSHASPTPRVGGVPIFGGLMVATCLLALQGRESAGFLGWVVVCSLPAFAVGLLEDCTKRVGPMARLIATFVSVALAYFLLGAVLTRVDLPWVDMFLTYTAVAFLLTIIAGGGIAHAINIIDGYNGLAGVVCALILVALAYMAYKVGDAQLSLVAVTMVGGLLGFLLWNYPSGAIFLGDGGAYLIGFVIALISILLVQRHEEVSAWFPLLLVAYPVWETLFSVVRRSFFHKTRAGEPDNRHLHQLVFRRLTLWIVGQEESRQVMRNSTTSVYLWLLAISTIAPAVVFFDRGDILLLCALGFAVIYTLIYLVLARGDVHDTSSDSALILAQVGGGNSEGNNAYTAKRGPE